jgi:hypothetical protein
MICRFDNVYDLKVWSGKWFIRLIREMIYKFYKVDDL